jgi:hypothetical protein
MPQPKAKKKLRSKARPPKDRSLPPDHKRAFDQLLDDAIMGVKKKPQRD